LSRFGADRDPSSARTPEAPACVAPADTSTRLEALESLGEAVVVISADGDHGYWNRAARALAVELGLGGIETPRLFEAGAIVAAASPEAPAPPPTETTRLTGSPCDGVAVGRRDGAGELRWLQVTTRPTGGDGPPYGVVSSYRMQPRGWAPAQWIERDPRSSATPAPALALPASDERRALRQARELFSTAFRRAPIGMALIDPNGRWLLVNQALCDLVGYSEPELLELKFHDVTHPDDLSAQLALMQEVLAGRRTGYQLDKRYLHADGHHIWVSISVSLVRDEAGAPLHLVTQVLDITERHQMEERLQHLADHDPLTGLLNRRRFEEELIRQLDRCRRYDEQATLVMVDLDHFKEVNDSLGHAAGDETLQSIAAALLGKIRSSDIIARVGGDEFAAILVGVGADQAATAAAGLAVVVREIDGMPVAVTASVGATVLTGDEQPDTALLNADEALYRVKAGGRDGASVAPYRPAPSVN